MGCQHSSKTHNPLQITAQDINKYQIISGQIYNALNLYHIKRSKKMNDDIFFNEFINNIDPDKKYFTKKDLNLFTEQEKSLDYNILNGGIPIILKSKKIIDKKMSLTRDAWKEFKEDYDNNEYKDKTLNVNSKKRVRLNNDREIKELWKKLYQHKLGTAYMSKVSNNFENKIDSIIINPKILKLAFENLEEEVLVKYDSIVKRKLENYFDIFINSIVKYYDPHSFYFSPAKSEEFSSQMKGDFKGLGLIYKEKNQKIIIEKVYPSSPALKFGLKKGDVITAVFKKNKDEEKELIKPQNVHSIHDFIYDLDEYDNTVTLEIMRKKKIKKITLKKETFHTFDNNLIYSIINFKGKKHGYVKIKSFYRDFKNPNYNVTNDLIDVIVILKKKGIDTLTLDLRNNGGGALVDAIDIAGLFIKSGPVVQTKNFFNQQEVYTDDDNIILYNGPLNVLINEYSASASEILASALKDYNRANIISSSPHSFGKGTVQQLLPLNSELFSLNEDLGSLKMTMNNFYTPKGKPIQQNGVSPDYSLENKNFNIKDYSILRFEKDLDHSITSNKIDSLSIPDYEKEALSIPKQLDDKIKKVISLHKELDLIKINNIVSISIAKRIQKFNKQKKLEDDIENVLFLADLEINIFAKNTNKDILVNFLDKEIKDLKNYLKSDYLMYININSF